MGGFQSVCVWGVGGTEYLGGWTAKYGQTLTLTLKLCAVLCRQNVHMIRPKLCAPLQTIIALSTATNLIMVSLLRLPYV